MSGNLTYQASGITSELPVTRQVGNSLRPSSTLRDFSRVIAFLLLLDESSEDTSGTAGPPAPCAVSQPPSVTVQRDRAAPFEHKPFVHGSIEKVFLQERARRRRLLYL
jgi:hypothetical protein